MRRIIFIVTTLFLTSYGKAQTFNITTSTTVNCKDDGTLTINFNNGTGPYYLSVYGPTGEIYNANILTNSHTFTNLRNGSYYIYGTDVNNNVDSKSAIITTPISISYTTTDETCTGNGSINAVASGGQAPYSYLWSTGATSSNITNVKSGGYGLTVTDNNGCILRNDSVYVKNTPSYSISFTQTNKTCLTKGSLTPVINGGTAPYTYLWNTSPIQTTSTLSNLDEGNYTLTVTDNNGCSQTASAYIYNSVYFNANTITSNENCNQADGNISISPTGGTAPYTYLWNTGATTPTISNLVGNKYYSVVITDNTNCKANTKYIYIYKNSPIQTSVSTTEANCNATGGGGGSVLVNATNGRTPYTYYWATGQTSNSLNNISAGGYYVNITDANGCQAHRYSYVQESASCYAIISGKVINDINNNCSTDAGESGLYSTIQYGPNNYAYVDQYGNYSFMVETGTYTLSVLPRTNWSSTCTPNTSIINATTGSSSYQASDLYLSPSSQITDVAVYAYSSAQRPGFTGQSSIYYYNNGTVNASGTVSYAFSNDWNFVSSSPMPDTYDAATRTATWSYNSLSPFESRSISINMSVASNISLGTPLSYTATISTQNTDSDLSNNSSSYTTNVVGSYDPNTIQVSPQGNGAEGYITTEEEMTYKINFQNTGTYVAENISVSNQIDANLKEYTLTVIDASHNYTTTIKDNLVTFEFPNIFLADSNSNEPASHGYIIYKINRISNLVAETKIYNKANIYFDYNTPVETNRVQNTIAGANGTTSSMGIGNVFTYYPNPCKDQLNIRFNAKTESTLSVQLYNMSGQNLSLTENLSVVQGEQSIQVDLSEFSIPNGLYIVKSILNEEVNTQQILIMK